MPFHTQFFISPRALTTVCPEVSSGPAASGHKTRVGGNRLADSHGTGDHRDKQHHQGDDGGAPADLLVVVAEIDLCHRDQQQDGRD